MKFELINYNLKVQLKLIYTAMVGSEIECTFIYEQNSIHIITRIIHVATKWLANKNIQNLT